MRLVLVSVIAALAATTSAHAADAECSVTQLKGVLQEVSGSRTKTQLHYSLVVTNRGGECAVFGAPTGVLLGKTRNVQRTHVLKPAGSKLYVVVRPGQAARSSLIVTRTGSCNGISFWFRLRGPSGSGTLDVPFAPHARVCAGGRLDFTYFGPG